MRTVPLQNPHRRLGAPADWNHADHGICHTLEIYDIEGFMVSAWEPTISERELIAKGKRIYLWIQGTVHPVVTMTVENDKD